MVRTNLKHFYAYHGRNMVLKTFSVVCEQIYQMVWGKPAIGLLW